MSKRIERLHTVEPAELRRLTCAAADDILEGATVVDDDAQGPSGIDLILVDDSGSPVLVDIVADDGAAIPSRVYEHTEWMEANARLFQRAYAASGVVRVEHPRIVFVARSFPDAVVRAVANLSDASVELVRATALLVDGRPELLLDRVEYVRHQMTSRPVARRAAELRRAGDSGFEDRIDAEPVRALFSLFKSGVDGLDGNISARDANGGLVFELQGKQLAAVGLSPGSFTVATGDPSLNPIVVSDRGSLERALNAVISFFVREERVRAADGADGGGPTQSAEREELRRIWGDGIPTEEQ